MSLYPIGPAVNSPYNLSNISITVHDNNFNGAQLSDQALYVWFTDDVGSLISNVLLYNQSKENSRDVVACQVLKLRN